MSEANGDHRFDFLQRGIQQTLASAGPRKLSAIRTVRAALLKEEQRLVAERPRVFLAVPAYNVTSMHDEVWAAFLIHPTDGENLTATQGKFSNSLLGRSFNHLWAQALTQRDRGNVTHFAMLHTDVAPEKNWLDKLWEEMVEHNADIMAAVIPFKSTLGLTSIAIDNPKDPWQQRRLTMTEVVEKLPETFSNEDVIAAGLNPDRNLLLQNTGCWMCDLRKPWVDAADEAGNLLCYFTIHDCIRKRDAYSLVGKEKQFYDHYMRQPPDFQQYLLGSPDSPFPAILAKAKADSTKVPYFVGVQPEDWNFSRMVQTVDPKARVFGTRKVRIEHKGGTGYPNSGAWGQWETDEDWKREQAEVEAKAKDDIPTAEAVEEPELVPA